MGDEPDTDRVLLPAASGRLVEQLVKPGSDESAGYRLILPACR